MENKDKLDNITDSMLINMNAEVSQGTSDANTPLEAIMKINKNKSKMKLNEKTPKIIEIDGHKLWEDQFTILLFKLLQLNNPDVDKLFTEANFNMSDLDGQILFPRPKNESKPTDTTK